MTRRVLIVTRRGDLLPERVAGHLAALAVEPVVLRTDGLPGAVHLSGTRDRLSLRTPDGAWTFDAGDALWMRRSAVGADLIDPDPGAVAAAHDLLEALLDAFPGFVVDRPAATRRAANKSWQHRVARAFGLRLPDTLLTASPAAAAAFLDRIGGEAITKMAVGTSVVGDGATQSVPTRRVDDTVRAGLPGLVFCPQVFQPSVPKDHELRVTVVGARVSVARLDSGSVAGAEVDWRRSNARTWSAWRPGTLPDADRLALLRLMDTAGLQYGAADFIVPPEGGPVFLEVNPHGELAWLELGGPRFPHSLWMAELLAGAPDARRGPHRPM